MNTEEKARAYDEALEKAKKYMAEGYTVLIPDLFPELKETEDERMTRVIGLALTDVPEERFASLGVNLKDCLGYLEKKKEQGHDGKKWIYEDDYRKDMDRSFNDGRDRVLENPEKYGLQKELPKEELVYRLNGLMQDYVKEGKDKEEKEHRHKCYRLFWDALEDTGYFERKEKKPAEWSDEDQKSLNRAINICINDFGENCETAKFLKSLPERFNLQPKQEWTGEDEEALREVKLNFELNHGNMTPELVGFYERFFNKLKSLRWQKDDGCISPEEGDIVVNKYGEISVFENWGHHPDGGSFNDRSYFFAKCTLDGDWFDDDCHPDSVGLRYATPEEIRKIMPYLLKEKV